MSEQQQDSTNDRRVVPIEEAIERIGPGERIHALRSGPFMTIGFYWSRENLIDAMTKHGVEEAGDGASAMGHTLVITDCDGSPLFIEAKACEVVK